MEENIDFAKTIVEKLSLGTSVDLIYKLRVVLALIGILTLIIATYASLSFSENCRELQCVGLIWIGAGNIASVFGLIPALFFLPWLTKKPLFKIVIIQKVAHGFAGAVMIFEWFIIVSTFGYW
jgi:hypothetical protein